MAVPAADFVHHAVQGHVPLIRRLPRGERRAGCSGSRVQRAHAYAQRAKRHARTPVPVQQVHGAVENVIAAIGGPVQRSWRVTVRMAVSRRLSSTTRPAMPAGAAGRPRFTQVQQRQARPRAHPSHRWGWWWSCPTLLTGWSSRKRDASSAPRAKPLSVSPALPSTPRSTCGSAAASCPTV